MLPNHAPLVIAEQFGTLEALYPGRIDLGLGRAPGTDMPPRARSAATSRATSIHSRDDVVELLAYFRAAGPDQRVRAVPGAGARGADLDPRVEPVRRRARCASRPSVRVRLALCAAIMLDEAIAHLPRERSAFRAPREPYLMLGVNVFAADSDARPSGSSRRFSRPSWHFAAARPVRSLRRSTAWAASGPSSRAPSSARPQVLRRWLAHDGPPRSRGIRRANPARRDHGDRHDLRSRCAPLVRDRERGLTGRDVTPRPRCELFSASSSRASSWRSS